MLIAVNTKPLIASLATLTFAGGVLFQQKSIPNEQPADQVAQLQAELQLKESQLQAMRTLIASHPLLNYRGPTEGNFAIAYNAKDDQPVNITVDHQRLSGDGDVSISSTTGTMLPGVPVVVQVTAVKRACLVDVPSPSNGWARLTIRVEGKDQHQASVHWSVPR